MTTMTHPPQTLRTFGDLSRSFNYLNVPPHGTLFAELILDHARRTPDCKALDVGCGQGIQRKPELVEQLRNATDELWGIEPDESVTPADGIYTNFQHAFLETASLPEQYFDLIYSMMVMEHVETPREYFAAVHRALKPGGTHMYCTPNGAHLFTILAKTLHTLKLDEMVLSAIRGGKKEDYHYPVWYRCNTIRTIDRLAKETGFEPPEYLFFETEGVRNYFPGPLRPLYWLTAARRRIFKNPRILATMAVRMKKPE